MTMTQYKKGDMARVHYGQLHERDPNRGETVLCFVCNAPHKGSGLARIEDKSGTLDVPLCDACLAADTADDREAVLRKFWNSPDLETRKATAEQFSALMEKRDKTEH
jgi:hypothetical protein